MNKHIFDLARQSGATDEHGNSAKEVFCFTKDELKDFAETLILKCADISADHWVKYKGCSAHFSIREHFGIDK